MWARVIINDAAESSKIWRNNILFKNKQTALSTGLSTRVLNYASRRLSVVIAFSLHPAYYIGVSHTNVFWLDIEYKSDLSIKAEEKKIFLAEMFVFAWRERERHVS